MAGLSKASNGKVHDKLRKKETATDRKVYSSAYMAKVYKQLRLLGLSTQLLHGARRSSDQQGQTITKGYIRCHQLRTSMNLIML